MLKNTPPWLLEQDSPEWHEFRKEHIGASDMPAVMGLDPWNKRDYMLQLKAGLIEPKPANAAMLEGKRKEEIARKIASAELGESFLPTVIEHSKTFIAASLDGLNFEGDRILEIKCPRSRKTFDMLSVTWGISENYMCQVQTQLLCVPEAKEAVFFVYMNDQEYDWITIEPIPYLQEQILEEADIFWKEVLELRRKHGMDSNYII